MNQFTDEILKTEVNKLYVWTNKTYDNIYETSIYDAGGIHPVERYKTETDAIIGHLRWCSIADRLKIVIHLGYNTIKDKLINIQRFAA
jgi:hypothetical protein